MCSLEPFPTDWSDEWSRWGASRAIELFGSIKLRLVHQLQLVGHHSRQLYTHPSDTYVFQRILWMTSRDGPGFNRLNPLLVIQFNDCVTCWTICQMLNKSGPKWLTWLGYVLDAIFTKTKPGGRSKCEAECFSPACKPAILYQLFLAHCHTSQNQESRSSCPSQLIIYLHVHVLITHSTPLSVVLDCPRKTNWSFPDQSGRFNTA